MRFAGIDIGSRTHVVAMVDEAGQMLVKPISFGEDAAGYERLFALLGSPEDVIVAMEATGHYGNNLCRALTEREFRIAVINPLRTRRFAEEDLMRAKTDSVDALGIARFAAQKRPAITSWDTTTDELRELVRYHSRLLQDLGNRVRQLHRLVHLGSPEFLRHVRTLDSQRATAILHKFPTASAFTESAVTELATLHCDGRRSIGERLARNLVTEARTSVGKHHGPAYHAQIRRVCEDIAALRTRTSDLASEICTLVQAHPVGGLLATIEGIGPVSVARILVSVGDPARFRSARALSAYVGVVPGTKASGLRWSSHAKLCPLGHARLRKGLYMGTLSAVQRNPWLRAYYTRLKANGKLPKVALVATMRKLLTAVYSVAKHRRPFVCPTNAAAETRMKPRGDERTTCGRGGGVPTG